MGNNITCAINCNYGVAATLYTLDTIYMVFFRHISASTLQKCMMMTIITTRLPKICQ
jgi:hypothetical protein